MFVGIKTWPCCKCYEYVQYQTEKQKFRGSGYRCEKKKKKKNLKIGQFTSLICQGRQRSVSRIIYVERAQPLFCSLNLLFADVLVTDTVVFCVRSLRDWPEDRLKYRQ